MQGDLSRFSPDYTLDNPYPPGFSTGLNSLSTPLRLYRTVTVNCNSGRTTSAISRGIRKKGMN
jgi:hypothetical protein